LVQCARISWKFSAEFQAHAQSPHHTVSLGTRTTAAARKADRTPYDVR